MNNHLNTSVLRFSVLLSCCLFGSCGPKDADKPSVLNATAYVNFGHRILNAACQATGICDIENAIPGRPFKNTSLQYIICQRPDNTDSMLLSFYPDTLKLDQDSSHFLLDQQGRYLFVDDYVFDSLDAVTTNIAIGTTIPKGDYETIVTRPQNRTKWTVIIPKVIKP